MASLRKDAKGRSPYWIACFTAADGRRLQKSTKQTNRAKATEVALALEHAEKLAGQGTLTEARTRELLAQVLERTTGETLPFHTAEGFLNEWLRGKAVSRSENTLRIYSNIVKGFLTHLGERAKRSIATITAKDVSAFRDAEIASGKNPNTVRHAISKLRTPFNAARRQGIITVNPAEAVELPEASTGEKQPLTPEQVEALLNAAIAREDGKPVFEDGDDLKGAILFSFYTGARLSDAANITWAAIDLPGKMLTFRDQKTKKDMKIHLHAELEAHLLDLPAPDRNTAPVFPKLAGKVPDLLSKRFAKVLNRAGLANTVIAEARGPKGRRVFALSFHSTRHGFNSEMANAGVSQELRRKLAGHTSDAMNARYTHHEAEPLRAAVNAIPGLSRAGMKHKGTG